MKFGSKLEKYFAALCDEAKVEWAMQYTLQKKRYDFFFPKYKMLVEIDGAFWHNDIEEGYVIDKWWKKKNFKNDALKNVIAQSLGFKILRIKESELKVLTSEQLLQRINELL